MCNSHARVSGAGSLCCRDLSSKPVLSPGVCNTINMAVTLETHMQLIILDCNFVLGSFTAVDLVAVTLEIQRALEIFAEIEGGVVVGNSRIHQLAFSYSSLYFNTMSFSSISLCFFIAMSS